MKNYIEQKVQEFEERFVLSKFAGQTLDKPRIKPTAEPEEIIAFLQVALTDLLSKVKEAVPDEYKPEEYISPTRLLDINTGYKICRSKTLTNLDTLTT